MKKFILTLIALLPLCSMMADNEPNVMVVKMKNGTTVNYAFADQPVVTISGADLVVTAHMYTATHALSDVQRYEFKYDATGIASPGAEDGVKQEGDIVSVCGAKAGESVAIYNAAGALVTSAKTDTSGRATVSLASLPTGVYVLSFQGGSTKIMKR